MILKKLLSLFVLTLLFSCSQQKKNDKTVTNSTETLKDSLSQNEPIVETDKTTTSSKYQTSTYDNLESSSNITDHKESLKGLSDKKVFSVISSKLTQTLVQKHQDYFKVKSDYELLSFAKGNLFQENDDDCAFIVYDKKNERISIIVYNAMKNKYLELFRDIKVKNGLETADCYFSAYNTLDYQLGDEILYQKEYLLKNPENYLESNPCKITDISKDDNFALKDGCFAKKVSKTNLSNTLCIATDSVYNNWECLKYDKESNTFLIFYGQAFAD